MKNADMIKGFALVTPNIANVKNNDGNVTEVKAGDFARII